MRFSVILPLVHYNVKDSKNAIVCLERVKDSVLDNSSVEEEVVFMKPN